VSISVIVPTVGRPTLWATLISFADDLEAGDAVIVIADRHSEYAQEQVEEFARVYPGNEWTYAWLPVGGGWGHRQRNFALDHLVRTTYVWSIDDDDVAAPGALKLLREHQNPDGWTMFKMTFEKGHRASGITIWIWPQVTIGNVGTPMMFAPVCDARYGLSYTGDFDYALALQEELGEPEWSEDVIALIRP
jgi:hypothetical protein